MKTFKIDGKKAISWNNKQYKIIGDESKNLDLCFCSTKEIYYAIMQNNNEQETFLEPAKSFNGFIIRYGKTEVQVKTLKK